MTDIIAELNRVELLAGMGKELLSQIAAVVVTKTLEPDETLVEEGSIGEDLYFVRSGSLLVTVMDGLKSTEVARLGPGGMDCYLCDSQSDESRLIAVNEGIHLHRRIW